VWVFLYLYDKTGEYKKYILFFSQHSHKETHRCKPAHHFETSSNGFIVNSAHIPSYLSSKLSLVLIKNDVCMSVCVFAETLCYKLISTHKLIYSAECV